MGEDGSTLRYWVVPSRIAATAATCSAPSRSAAAARTGYGGPVVMAVYVARDGSLRDLRIVRSRETPAYVESLAGWLKGLPGRNVFRADGLEGVDAVTGATITSGAILGSLGRAGPKFCTGRAWGSKRRPRRWRRGFDRPAVCLSGRGSSAWRLAAPLSAAGLAEAGDAPGHVLAGLVWNLQYGSQQVMGILNWNYLPGDWLSGSFFLVLVVPVAVMLFGNVYCGGVAFGAAQELVGDLRPRAAGDGACKGRLAVWPGGQVRAAHAGCGPVWPDARLWRLVGRSAADGVQPAARSLGLVVRVGAGRAVVFLPPVLVPEPR